MTGQEIATAGVRAMERPVATLDAIQAVQRIRAWHTLLDKLSSAASVEIMEATIPTARTSPRSSKRRGSTRQ